MTIIYGQFPQRAIPEGALPERATVGQVVSLDAVRKRGGVVSKAKKPKKTIVTVVQDAPKVEVPQVALPQTLTKPKAVKEIFNPAPQDDFRWVLDSEPFAMAMGAIAAAPKPRKQPVRTEFFTDDEEEALHLIMLLAA